MRDLNIEHVKGMEITDEDAVKLYKNFEESEWIDIYKKGISIVTEMIAFKRYIQTSYRDKFEGFKGEFNVKEH